MNERGKAYLYLHSAVLLFGLTGVLGHIIELDRPVLVWYRMGLTVVSLLFFRGMLQRVRAMPRRTLWALTGIGALVALHWMFFFTAVTLTSVSVTLCCLAAGSFFTSLLEPVMLRTPAKWYQVALGAMVVPGVYLVSRGAEDDGNLLMGIMVALLATLLSSIFGILNKKIVEHYEPVSVTFVELTSGWLMMCALMAVWIPTHPEGKFVPQNWEWMHVSVLAFLCTTYAFIATLRALKVLSAFSVSLSINLEPIYSIILAFFLLHEHKKLTWEFYLGAGIIFATVFSHPLLERWYRRPGEDE